MVEEQLATFEQELEEEELIEREKTEKSIQALQEERAKILSNRKQKIQDKVKSLSDNKEEQQKLLQSHSEDTQRLVNKIDADRLRIEADLQERIRKRREAKLKVKESEKRDWLLQKRKEREEVERIERQKIAKEESQKLQALQETVEEAMLPGEETGERFEVDEDGRSPSMLQSALPLSEEQLTSLLLSTPLYHKLEQIKSLVQNRSLVPTPQSGSQSVQAYIDPKDALWVNDTDFHPVDISSIPVQAFVVYKFGCCVINSLVTHCNHKPVSLLIADQIPPNVQLSRNAFRNSFFYEAHNRILYMRQERLDNVGEFVLVLVHTLSHIKAGGFYDDWDPVFVREFYHSLSICCSELFFSRNRSSSSESSHEPNFLETVFGRTETMTERLNIVNDVIDTRVMMDVDQDGSEFSHGNVMARLAKYSEFAVGSRLRTFLDKVEPKELSDTSSPTPAPTVETADLPRQFQRSPPVERQARIIRSAQDKRAAVTQSLTTKVKQRAAAKRSRRRHLSARSESDQVQQFLEVQVRDLQHKVNSISEESTQLAQEREERSKEVRTLENELKSQTEQLKTLQAQSDEFDARKQAVRDATARLSAAKANLATFELRVSACLKRLDGFRTQLEQKQKALQEHTATH